MTVQELLSLLRALPRSASDLDVGILAEGMNGVKDVISVKHMTEDKISLECDPYVLITAYPKKEG